jgi:YD repeat-containing protein
VDWAANDSRAGSSCDTGGQYRHREINRTDVWPQPRVTRELRSRRPPDIEQVRPRPDHVADRERIIERDRQQLRRRNKRPPDADDRRRARLRPVRQTFEYNTAGDTIRATLAGLSSNQHFDQSGNVTSQTEPNRNEAKYDYDSRGALMKETLPDSNEIKHQTSALGVPTKYTDQVSQNTAVTDKDFIGRPVRREYADGTFEHFARESHAAGCHWEESVCRSSS